MGCAIRGLEPLNLLTDVDREVGDRVDDGRLVEQATQTRGASQLGINPGQDIRDVLDINGSQRLLAQVSEVVPRRLHPIHKVATVGSAAVGSAVQNSDDSTHALHPFQRYFGPEPDPLTNADFN